MTVDGTYLAMLLSVVRIFFYVRQRNAEKHQLEKRNGSSSGCLRSKMMNVLDNRRLLILISVRVRFLRWSHSKTFMGFKAIKCVTVSKDMFSDKQSEEDDSRSRWLNEHMCGFLSGGIFFSLSANFLEVCRKANRANCFEYSTILSISGRHVG